MSILPSAVGLRAVSTQIPRRRFYGFAGAPDGSGGQSSRGCSVRPLAALGWGGAAALRFAAASGMEKSGAFA